jgi:drug/metabolite transporter (DMT)-like permease
MAIVGSSVVAGKLLVDHVPVFLAAGLRFGLASLVLVPLVLATEREAPSLGSRDLAVLALQAFTGIFAFNALLLHGLTLTSAAEAGIVTSTTPAVAAALAALVLREGWSRGRAAAVGLAVLGLAVMHALAPGGAARGPRPLLGNLLVLGAVLGESVYLVCSRVLARRASPLAVAAGISVLGFLMFLPFALRDAAGFHPAALGAADWLVLLWYAVGVSVGAVLLWMRGVRWLPAGTAAVFTGLLPVSAVALAHVVLGEPVLPAHVAGGVCVIAAVVLAARSR